MRASVRFVGIVPVVLLLHAGPAAIAREGARTLTLDERIAAQRAIERVYYSHQAGATTPFEEAVTREMLESKVKTYLKRSVALERFWGAAVTAEALSAEVARMAKETRLPGRLRELYAALGDDPFLVHECLARPALVERLAQERFATDPALHAPARGEAETLRERLAGGGVEGAGPGRSRAEVLLVRRGAGDPAARGASEGTLRVDLGPEEFERWRALAPKEAGLIGDVLEEARSFQVRVIEQESAAHVRLAVHGVPKTTWGAWWREVESGLDENAVAAVASPEAVLPAPGGSTEAGSAPGGAAEAAEPREPTARHETLAGSCSRATWSEGPADASAAPAGWRGIAAWTGSLLIVRAAAEDAGVPGEAMRYDPATDAWTSSAGWELREGRPAVWTSGVLPVWGGGPDEYAYSCPPGADADGDGFSPPCDCDDANAAVYPAAPQVCGDGLNNDCDHASWPSLGGTNESDDDGDSFTECGGDCDDDVWWTNPDSYEDCDGIDNDCDGVVPADEVDADGDGDFLCRDCDDADPARGFNHREICDGIDNDCDGLQSGEDEDGDGWLACDPRDPQFYVDCDDHNPDVYPGAPWLCDGAYNNCTCKYAGPPCSREPDIDEDSDGDGFSACQGDCVDRYWLNPISASIHPSAPEICDAWDNDCDGQYDEDIAPVPTTCGVGACASTGISRCVDGSLSDSCVPGSPAPEICDGVDNDCDGQNDEDVAPVPTTCGVGACASAGISRCVDGSLSDSCVPGSPAPEVCDGWDNDCDGTIDEGIRFRVMSTVNPSTLKVGATRSSFTVSLQVTDFCDPSYPLPVSGDRLGRTYLSRAASTVLPDPLSLPCPAPGAGYAVENGIVENPADRVTAQGGAALKFNLGSDGDCRTLDGDRQDLLALLAGVPDKSEAPVCVAGTVDGVPFETCTTVTVENRGNR